MAKNTTEKVKSTGSGATPLTYAVSTQPLARKCFYSKRRLTYTTAANFVGTDSLYFTDGWACQKSAPAKIKITVTATALTAAAIESKGIKTSVPQEKL